MQVLGQLVSFFFSITARQFDLICGTILSLILTFVAMFRHGDVQRHKSALPRFSKAKYFWLIVSSVVVASGLPLIAGIFLSPNMNPNAFMILTNITLNGPGIVYYIQALSFFPKRKFKFKLPKYL